MRIMRILILNLVLLFSLLSCGKPGVLELNGKETAAVVKPNVTFIENHEQFITLEYNESFTATSCSISNLVGLSETTSCSCSVGVCTVGLTPTGTGSGSYTFTVSDGVSSSDAEVITVETKEVVPFVSTWRVGDGAYGDGDLTVTLPLRSDFNYNFTVDWGDGTTEEVTAYNDPHINHTYGSAGNKVITISGLVEAWYFNGSGDKDKIISIQELGRVGWRNFEGAFKECTNLGNVNGGDVSEVVNMRSMFANINHLMPWRNTILNVDTSSWNTSKVTDMSLMFYGLSSSNPDTSNWDTSSVTAMQGMFWALESGNPDTSNWDTSNVTTMEDMFRETVAANPDTSNWNTSSVTTMAGMFWASESANPDTSNWDTSNVTTMEDMFLEAVAANPDTSNWDTSSVTSMSSMFQNTVAANPDTSSWNTTSLLSASFMFMSAQAANPVIKNWDTSSLNTIYKMFQGSLVADPDFSNWDFSNISNLNDMIRGVTLSTENYDTLLIQLDATSPMSGWTFEAGSSTYTTAGPGGAARSSLIGKGMSFNDGGGI